MHESKKITNILQQSKKQKHIGPLLLEVEEDGVNPNLFIKQESTNIKRLKKESNSLIFFSYHVYLILSILSFCS